MVWKVVSEVHALGRPKERALAALGALHRRGCPPDGSRRPSGLLRGDAFKEVCEELAPGQRKVGGEVDFGSTRIIFWRENGGETVWGWEMEAWRLGGRLGLRWEVW